MMPERNILNIWSELCRRYQRIFIHQFDSLNTAEIWIYSATLTKLLCRFF